jgi:hypothetical protein
MNLHNSHALKEASLTNFLFYGFLIKDLGAEIWTAKDFRKCNGTTDFGSATDLTILSMADQYGRPVRYGRECAHKSRAQAAHSSPGDYMHAVQHQQGGKRAHQWDQGDVSSCRFCRV